LRLRVGWNGDGRLKSWWFEFGMLDFEKCVSYSGETVVKLLEIIKSCQDVKFVLEKSNFRHFCVIFWINCTKIRNMRHILGKLWLKSRKINQNCQNIEITTKILLFGYPCAIFQVNFTVSPKIYRTPPQKFNLNLQENLQWILNQFFAHHFIPSITFIHRSHTKKNYKKI
jgi:hypothetical protein